ncbi:fam-b protein [Plasmodium chabaudi chabaudi]|uniref:Fam-b protein n=1 Tax=Plasmodium chabaudi chabaudi TaxID=31271 RepID=A0A1D3LGA6_PLACU|nr:fam-b protein [Plasmodium chabaudi chabaudi]
MLIMKPAILKSVFFSIIICSFEYAKNELYFISERNIYLERNVINFKNNRILSDADNQFDLNDFYKSTWSLANQLNDYNDVDDDDEDTKKIRNIINSHIKEHKESNTLPNLNNVDKKTKNLIHKLRKKLEGMKKKLDNIRNDEIEIQPTQDKRIANKDDKFEDEYNEITSSKQYEIHVIDRKLKKAEKKFVGASLVFIASLIIILASGVSLYLLILLTPCAIFMCKNFVDLDKLAIKKLKMLA